MAPPTFDLQSHSTRSDGQLEPAEVVAAAARAGVEVLSLTDHDTIDGVDEALAAGAEHGVRVVPGAELSALDGGHEDLHICGYLLDTGSVALREALAHYRGDRARRARRMLEALTSECGFAAETGALEERFASGDPVGRPHLAQAVFEHPDNAARLASEGLGDHGQVLEAYLIPGRPAYRRREEPTVGDAIELIHGAGGVAVWAHPFWNIPSGDEVLATIDRFAELGLDGVEVFYVANTPEQTRLGYDHCRARGLITTGSADFHGPDHPQFHAFRAFELFGLEPDLGPLA